MKKFAYLSLSIFAATALFSDANAASTSGTAYATVQQALSVSEDEPMSFGTFSSGATGGTITTGGTTTGDVDYASGAQQALFSVTGAAGQTYTVTRDATVVLDDLGGAGDPMTATLNPVAAQSLDGSGNDTFNVGGTLAVNANQLAGNYSGTYNISVNYP